MAPLWPHLLTYAMSFLMLGIFWVGQQTQLNYFTQSNRKLTWIHIVFLLVISLMPFSTALLATFITYRLAVVAYWLNIFLPGIMLFISVRYAWKAGLVKDDTPLETSSALERRIVNSQILYAFSALLCIFNTYWSIGCIILVQLVNFVIRW